MSKRSKLTSAKMTTMPYIFEVPEYVTESHLVPLVGKNVNISDIAVRADKTCAFVNLNCQKIEDLSSNTLFPECFVFAGNTLAASEKLTATNWDKKKNGLVIVGYDPFLNAIEDVARLFQEFGEVSGIEEEEQYNLGERHLRLQNVYVLMSSCHRAKRAIDALRNKMKLVGTDSLPELKIHRFCWNQTQTNSGYLLEGTDIKDEHCSQRFSKKIGSDLVNLKKLFVGNLDFSVTEIELAGLFAKFGLLQEIYMMRKEDGLSKGSAFVVYTLPISARNAIIELHGVIFRGRHIVVNVAT
jgi:hypothetical protein